MKPLQNIQFTHFAVREGVLYPILFFGDQQTTEHSRKCQEYKVSDKSKAEALLGVVPAILDWHAEAEFTCNVSANETEKFNETLDFFELVVVAHVLAASTLECQS